MEATRAILAFLGFILSGTAVYFLARRGVRKIPPLLLSGYRLLFSGMLLSVVVIIWNSSFNGDFAFPTGQEIFHFALLGVLCMALPNALLFYAFEGEDVDESMAAFVEGAIPGLVLIYFSINPLKQAVNVHSFIPFVILAVIGLSIFLNFNPFISKRWKPSRYVLAVLFSAFITAAGFIMTQYIYRRPVEESRLLMESIRAVAATTLVAGFLALLYASIKMRKMPRISPLSIPYVAALALVGTCLGWTCFFFLAFADEIEKLLLVSSGIIVIPVVTALVHLALFKAKMSRSKKTGSALILLALIGIIILTFT